MLPRNILTVALTNAPLRSTKLAIQDAFLLLRIEIENFRIFLWQKREVHSIVNHGLIEFAVSDSESFFLSLICQLHVVACLIYYLFQSTYFRLNQFLQISTELYLWVRMYFKKQVFGNNSSIFTILQNQNQKQKQNEDQDQDRIF